MRRARKQYMLEDMQAAAEKHGGKCLSRRFVRMRHKMRWECAKGHKWLAVPYHIVKGSVWCPTCAGRPMLSIADMQGEAAERGGKCLSKRYAGLKGKLLWQCAGGHQWRASASTIRHHKSWCPRCSKVARHTLSDMKALAKKRGGKCLSKSYKNVYTLMSWECRQGHRWQAKPVNVIYKETWCHTCSRYGKLTIEEMRRIAVERGGECLSKQYVNVGTKLKWKCSKGHTWMATPNDIRSRKSWCPQCAKCAPLTITRLRQAARKRSGVCLSTRYVVGRKLRWKCSNGHQWEAHANGVLRGSWCPQCFNSYCYSESRCRYIFEKLLKTQFPQNRKRLDGLQLDGYAPKLKLAFEYNGKQHYDERYYFHTNRSFVELQKRDRRKKMLCKKLGIRLIIIPYNRVKTNEQLLTFIVKELERSGIPLKRPPATVDPSNILVNKSILEELGRIAGRRGIRCLSKTYINSDTKLQWECSLGHQWLARAVNIKQGYGCPFCSGRKKNSIMRMREFAEAHGGKCLSKRYKNIASPLLWECVNGHRWKTDYSNLYHGKRWCQQCKIDAIFDAVCEIAKDKGGRCLSPRYINDDTKLLWECGKGHQWMTRPRLIKDGAWCPACNDDSLRLTLADIRETAKKRGFTSLATEYINNAQKLPWKCWKGHVWFESTNMIRNHKSNCPHCGRESRKALSENRRSRGRAIGISLRAPN